MLTIPCPWCGSRDQHEFSFGGEADRRRPSDPSTLGDDAWSAYLYLRDNKRGRGRYLACHTAGCGMWFAFEIDTMTHEVSESGPLTGAPKDANP